MLGRVTVVTTDRMGECPDGMDTTDRTVSTYDCLNGSGGGPVVHGTHFDHEDPPVPYTPHDDNDV